jgi:transcriptional regulator
MLKRAHYQNRIELLQGTLDLLILQALQWGPQHGYGISQALRSHSADILQVDTGSLYPALHRLERQRWIRAEWKVSERNQRARGLSTHGGRAKTAARRALPLGADFGGDCDDPRAAEGEPDMKMPLWRRRQDAELDEELASHLRMAIADRIARGESPEAATRAARLEMGNLRSSRK